MLKTMMNGLLAALMLTGMCACTSNDAAETAQVETSLISFDFFEASMEEMGGHTRADDAVDKTYSRLDIAIFPETGAASSEVLRFHQQKGVDGFGKLSVRVPKGKYRLVAVANNSNAEVDIQSAELAVFANSTVTDMAFVTQVVDATNNNATVKCQLQRAVAKFCLQSSDLAPEGLSKVALSLTGVVNDRMNPSTGFAVKDGEKTFQRSWNIDKKKFEPGKLFGCSIYVLLPVEQATVSVDAAMYGSENQILKDLHFDNVGLQQNHVTTYTGPIFSYGGDISFTFNNADFQQSEHDASFE